MIKCVDVQLMANCKSTITISIYCKQLVFRMELGHNVCLIRRRQISYMTCGL